MTEEKEKWVLCSAWPYVNAVPHLGTILHLLCLDIYARYLRLQGKDVITATGSDTHGTPIQLAAERDGISPKELANRNHRKILEILKQWNIDIFYSTTENPFHYQFTQDFYKRCYENGYIFSKEEEQFYCETCQRFLPDRFIEGKCPYCEAQGARGDQCENCGKPLTPEQLIAPYCVISEDTPTKRRTKHWYYNFPAFQDRLLKFIEENNQLPENAKRFSLELLTSEGLLPRAITRDLKWGIPIAPAIPEEGVNDKTFYVWFEAVLGYVSASAEQAVKVWNQPEKWKEYWLNKDTKTVFFIGKDNIFFHTLLFPGLLLGTEKSYGGELVLPYNVSTTEFLLFGEDLKFSKSRGVGIWADEAVELLPADYWRYYLSAIRPEKRDTSFLWSEFEKRINIDLNDSIGNFVHRALTLIHRYFNGKVPPREKEDEIDQAFIKEIQKAPQEVAEAMDKFEYRQAIEAALSLARAANAYLSNKEPWHLIKTDKVAVQTILNLCAQAVRTLSILLFPFIPVSTEKIWSFLKLSFPLREQNWFAAEELAISDGHEIGKPSPLFLKVDTEHLKDKLREVRGEKPIKKEEKPIEKKPAESKKSDAGYATIQDLEKLQLKVGKVIEAEPVEGAKKLLKLQVDLGEKEPRQLVAGLAKIYKPEELIGQTIIVASNLEPAEIRGVKSNGMLLAAVDKNKVVFLTPSGDMPPGSKVM
ncbi:MAG: methionine--tRNA ligase [Candidatus Hermodarchaeota archaeon]